MSLSEGQGQVGSGSHTASLSPGQGGLNYEDPFGLEREQTVFRKGGAGVGGVGGVISPPFTQIEATRNKELKLACLKKKLNFIS